ncbi:hypothetical protein R3I94_006953 [Phoxinus phoxinus]
MNTHSSCPCCSVARSLLSSLTHIMQKKGKMEHQVLFAGFNCTDLEAQMIPHTQTGSACQPNAPDEVMSCSSQRNSSFSEAECLRNISSDLHYYQQLLNNYKPTASDLSPVMTATADLMHCLKVDGAGADREWSVWISESFDNRVLLCKTLKGFHVRAVTMNRALAYIASGDHRK